MDYLFLIVSSVLILACLYFVISPFYLMKQEVALGNEYDQGLNIESVYEAVNELEMDYLMKKIKKEDFLQLKEQYQVLAQELMAEERQLVGKKGKEKKQSSNEKKIELEILHELQKMRKLKGS